MLPSIPLIRLGALVLFFSVQASAEPVISGRVNSQLEPELKGHVLIEELNCAACHSGEASLGNRCVLLKSVRG